MSISGITRKNCRLAIWKRLTPTIAWLANLRVKVAGDGTDINRRGCRPAHCHRVAYVDERGGVGIRLEPAAVRRYGEQFRRAPRRRPAGPPKPSRLL